MSSTAIEAESKKLVKAGCPECRIAKTTLDDLLSGESWAPTKSTLRALVKALGLDEGQTRLLHEAAEEAERARVTARKRLSSGSSHNGQQDHTAVTVASQIPISDGALRDASMSSVPDMLSDTNALSVQAVEDSGRPSANGSEESPPGPILPSATEMQPLLYGVGLTASAYGDDSREVARPGVVARRHPNRRLWIYAVSLIVGAIVLLVTLNFRTWQDSPAPERSGRFAIPVPGDTITSPIDLRGFATIPLNEQLWVLQKAPNNIYYTVTNDPAPVSVDAQGDWTVRNVGVGKNAEDFGKQYEFFLISSPRGVAIEIAVNQIPSGRHSANFKEVPAEATVLDSLPVTLSGAS